MRKLMTVLVAVLLVVFSVGCSKNSPTGPSFDPPTSSATVSVEYTGAVSGEAAVSLQMTSSPSLSITVTMEKTGPNIWKWQGDSATLKQFQDVGDVNFSVLDLNLGGGSDPSQFRPGYPINVSTRRDGNVLLSSQETNISNVWDLGQDHGYYGKFRFMQNDTVMLIAGPGVPQ